MANALSATLSADVYAQTVVLTIDYTYNVPDPSYRWDIALHIVVERTDMKIGWVQPEMYQSYVVKLYADQTTPFIYGGEVVLPIYPVPSNTQLKISLYEGTSATLVQSIYVTTNAIETDANYIDLKEVASDRTGWLPPVLTEDQKEHNVDIIYDKLKDDNWTIEAIACIAGFCDFYSDLNPDYNFSYLLPFDNLDWYANWDYLTINASYSSGLSYHNTDGQYGTYAEQFGMFGGYPYADTETSNPVFLGSAIPANNDYKSVLKSRRV